jgi:hypothetical protein
MLFSSANMNESNKLPVEPKLEYLPNYEGCVICGNKTVNPHTLGLRFKVTDKGVETFFVSDAHKEGYNNIVHGGITSALLDETIERPSHPFFPRSAAWLYGSCSFG